VITRAELERLSDLHDPAGQLISLYLHIDKGRTDEDHTIHLKNLLREAESSLDRQFGKDAAVMAQAVSDRIRHFVRDDAGQYHHGIALFANLSGDIWEAVDLPGTVESSVAVDQIANVAPLVRVFEDHPPFCTCLVSRDHARVFYGRYDSFDEITELVDDVPGQHDQGGWSQSRYERHIEDHVQRHFKRVAQYLFEMREEKPYRFLVLGGTEEVVAGFTGGLHPYVSERIIGEIRVLMEANINDIAKASREEVRRWVTSKKQKTVQSLVDEALSRDLGVQGLPDTLRAIHQGQILSLVIDADLKASGVRCEQCGSLHLSSDTENRCHYCQGEVTDLEDLIPAMVGSAFRQRADIVFVDEDDQREQLARLGGIGALLRFRLGD
jgi:peptide chain release factor subunit 1